jgi:DNA modification methylase
VKQYDILQGDVLARLADLPDNSVHCVVTSPPYFGLRDYGTGQWEGGSAECQHKQGGGRDNTVKTAPALVAQDGYESAFRSGTAYINQGEAYRDVCGKCGAHRIDRQIGLEPTPAEFIETMVSVFREVRRVLRPDGTCWLNMGDSYANAGQTGGDRRGTLHEGGKPAYTPIAGLKPKDLLMMPARVALALQAEGWWIRSEITWAKRAPMPESVRDRPTSATEKIYLLTKSERYFYDADAVREPQADPARGASGQRVTLKDERPQDGVRNRTLNEIDRNGNQRAYNPAGRNMWNYWLLGPEPYAAAHFATFPTEIPRRCISAGTSEHGCCGACGAPWRRVVERTHPPNEVFTKRHAPVDGYVYSGSIHNGEWKGHGQKLQDWRNANPDRTVGWEPTCRCEGAGVVPCTVLDPFAGAGTTLMVALRLGRRALGIELNPEYIAMSRRRIESDPQAMNLRMDLTEEIA